MPNNQNKGYRPVAWFLLMTFFIGYVLYMVSYTGNDWYVVPVEPYKYPPDNQSAPVKMGLFWMCVYTHCKYDLKVDYMVVKYLPFKDIQYSYQNYRTLIAGIITAGMILLCLAFGAHLVFLSGFSFSKHIGFVSGALQIIACILSLIGIGMYGTHFRGSTINNPFGWSLWLMLASVIWIIVNGISVLIITVVVELDKGKAGNSDFNKPLMAAYA